MIKIEDLEKLNLTIERVGEEKIVVSVIGNKKKILLTESGSVLIPEIEVPEGTKIS